MTTLLFTRSQNGRSIARGAGHGPTLIEHVTYRAGAHSTSDDPSAYRPKEESDAWPLGDPIERVKNYLIKRGAYTEERYVQNKAEIESEIARLQKEAEANGTLHDGPHSSPREMFEDVYKETPEHLAPAASGSGGLVMAEMKRMTMIQAINNAMGCDDGPRRQCCRLWRRCRLFRRSFPLHPWAAGKIRQASLLRYADQ